MHKKALNVIFEWMYYCYVKLHRYMLNNLAGLVTRLFRSGGRTHTAWEETHGGGGVVAW